MSPNFKIIPDEAKYHEEMTAAGGKLVIVNFTSSRCPPCQRIAPVFAAMGENFPGAHFLSVEVPSIPSVAQANGVQATPTFIFFRNKVKIDSLQGGDADALEAKVRKHYSEADKATSSRPAVAGHMDLLPMINKKGCECLNQNSDFPYTNALFSSVDETFLESDADEQLILCVDFTQLVKIHSLRIKGPHDTGPKTVRLFINQPYALDFDSAMNNIAAQELVLTEKILSGSLIKLNYLKFQNVQNITLFIQDNQEGGEVTRLNSVQINGSPMATTNMSEFKRISGKAGESH